MYHLRGNGSLHFVFLGDKYGIDMGMKFRPVCLISKEGCIIWEEVYSYFEFSADKYGIDMGMKFRPLCLISKEGCII